MRLLDAVVWATPGGERSRPHLVGYLGPPPDHTGTRTVCGRPVPVARLVAGGAAGAGAGHALCPTCQALLALHGPAHYEQRQRQWEARDRRTRTGDTDGRAGA